MNHRTIYRLVVALCIFLSLGAKGQSAFMNRDNIYRVFEGITYVVMEDTTTATAVQYKSVIRKYWTASRIKIILPNQIRSVDTVKNSIFNISKIIYIKDGSIIGILPYLRLRQNGKDLVSIYVQTDPYKYEKTVTVGSTQNKAARQKDSDYIYIQGADQHIIASFSYGDPSCTWGPGIMKNYIQQIMAYLKSRVEQKSGTDIAKDVELNTLKNKTLYVPDYMLIEYIPHGMGPSEMELRKRKPEEFMKNYPYPYKIATAVELNKMILDSTKGIYYVLYNFMGGTKTISVTNSATGEVIYSEFVSMNFGLKPKDMKMISEAIIDAGTSKK